MKNLVPVVIEPIVVKFLNCLIHEPKNKEASFCNQQLGIANIFLMAQLGSASNVTIYGIDY